jgi:PAS domain S-box-containing protein
LDAFPWVALLLRPRTREIVASNQAAVQVGAIPGTRCFSTWGQRETPCPWCLAPQQWATGQAQHLEVEALGVIWDAYWIPVSEDLYMHFAFDITARRRAEDELRASETKFRAVFETSVDAIGVSKKGVHVFVNPAYCTLFGYGSAGELVGTSILNLIAPEQREKIAQNVRRRARNEAIPSFYETRGLRKDGSEFEMDVHISTYELQGETFSLVILRDITEQKQAKAVQQRSHEELEQRVQARTAELQQFVDLMVGREIRMAELKSVVRQLRAQLQSAGMTPVADDPLAAGME